MHRFYPHPVIAREGWPFIIAGLVLSIIVTAFAGWWSLPFWVFTVFALQFFRDPSRPIPQDADAVLCPADGRIVVVERALDPYREIEALKISVFMNVFNVHSQRSPIDGTVTAVEYNAGKFVNAALDKASTENERNAVLVTTRSGREITFVQVAGLVARRILCYAKVGDSLVRGERYGFIRFGSRVDVYLPIDAQAQVSIGDKVSASSTILARLPLAAPEKTSETATVEATEAIDAAPVRDMGQTEIEASAEKVRQAVEKELNKDS
ncbi:MULTISPECIES: phosphatidylserine decarboxylase [unclassified Neisseria]|uniref:phosphatidylserine decarboxylase n=1 Tax=unclassified Neisseria TaxID=2623750 RepID=UPI0026651ECB|nr:MULTISPECIES: phosphatidylserine decarboxylase [unclassified Neisseria]MDO1510537.1 phosphatidylserine decarboxylase [Neisseria sp. MVDL19-042950]MDO1516330.1 phosphatidylserine decarboxylase [Neisseria sp. MVDL18-041461]MDO1564124.1 phosphatidylserine decarboxylase [Neisseria sp. MVDL20-010259]